MHLESYIDAARTGVQALIVAPGKARAGSCEPCALPHELSRFARLDSRGRLSPRVRGLLDFSVGERFQFFDDLLQPAATLGVILLRWQGASLLGILFIESLDVTDLCLQQVDTAKDRFSSI
jgi:hypothetical protein